MFIILMLFLLMSSVLVMIAKRNRETLFIFGMCMSLIILLLGMLLYIAKKGGLSSNLLNFFYFNHAIKVYFQYFMITLDNLGFIVAIGRFLFPLFLMLLSLHYSAITWVKQSKWIYLGCFFLPICSLILYYPGLFHLLSDGITYLNVITRIWIIGYIIGAIFLLFYEAYSIQIHFMRRQFIVIMSFVLSLTMLYLLYFGQEPAYIYDFYIAGNSIYYIKSAMSVPAYLLIVTVNIVCAAIGFTGLLRYTKNMFEANKKEIVIQQKVNSISVGTAVFVHGFKNQLLANRVIHKRLKRSIDNKVNASEIKDYTDQLYKQNEKMLTRIEELYRSIKTNQIHLNYTSVQTIIDNALSSFYDKHPHKCVDVHVDNLFILADQVRLSEAVYNLLINAQEAVNAGDSTVRCGISLHCFHTRQYTVIKIADSGVGMSKKEMKKIFDPFYSSKNSNHNWGMGLQYVRKIIKEHFGMIRYESRIHEGTTFFILLPKLKA